MTVSDDGKLVKIPELATTGGLTWELEAPEIIAIPYPFTMSKILKEQHVGKFAIEKTVTHVGTIIEGYDKDNGKIRNVKLTFEYPVVKLTEDGNTWMSDTLFEVESNMGAVEMARGDVLTSGLGIGLLPTLMKDKVSSIDIIEVSQDVVDLVFHQIATEKMKIIRDELCHYLTTTEKKYDLICIDIWQDTLLPLWDMDGMKNIAQRCLKPGGNIWCWLEEVYEKSPSKQS
jgi:hypothetical protein